MIVAKFPCEDALARAVARLREDGIGPVETYTPAPMQDVSTGSPLPVVILVAALLGGAASFALQTWSYTVAYPFPIGNRPQFAWPSFIPTVFENAVLIAIAAGFAGFLLINRMPRLYDPVDEAAAMREASSDGWVLAIATDDESASGRARQVLLGLSADSVEEVRP